MAIVAGLALSIGEYGNVVVNGVLALQSGLVSAMGGAPSVGGLIDTMTDPYTKLVEALMSAGTAGMMPKFSLILAAVLVAVAQAILFPIALGMYLLAKVGLALLLAVGPIFVACALFPATQRFTESWLSATLSMVLTSVLLAASIGMVGTLAGEFAAAVLAQVGSTAFLADVVALLLLSIALVIVVLNVNTLAAAITGGVSLSGVGRDAGRAALRGISGGASAVAGLAARRGSGSGGSIARAGSATASAPGDAAPLYRARVIEQLQRSARRGQ